MNYQTIKKTTLAGLSILFILIFGLYFLPYLFSVEYEKSVYSDSTIDENLKIEEEKSFFEEAINEQFNNVIWLDTPSHVRAIYMTGWVAGVHNWREEIVDIIDSTELNAIVIDIKDETGRLSFSVSDPRLQSLGVSERRIPDVKEFIKYLNDKHIYVIGRLSVFQDPFFASKFPANAVKRKNDGSIWKDRKGISWVDPGSTEMWEHILLIAKEAHKIGFDEINFDYVRFPSDGNMSDIFYPKSEGKGKREVMKDFFIYLNKELKEYNMVISADLFGMTATAEDDMNIGQYLEDVLPYFDFVSHMVYPSHYPPGFNGHSDPNKVPYDIIKHSMTRAVERAEAIGESPKKLRPWLQDFNYGGFYGRDEVRAQIQAVYDSGLSSWMIWNPSNRYDRQKYEI